MSSKGVMPALWAWIILERAGRCIRASRWTRSVSSYGTAWCCWTGENELLAPGSTRSASGKRLCSSVRFDSGTELHCQQMGEHGVKLGGAPTPRDVQTRRRCPISFVFVRHTGNSQDHLFELRFSACPKRRRPERLSSPATVSPNMSIRTEPLR